MRARLVTAVASLGLAVLSALGLIAIEPQIRAEDVLEREAAALALLLQIGLDLFAFLGLAQRLDAEGDLAVSRIHHGDLGLELLPRLEQPLRLVDPVHAQL